jgi:hypothetical protein
MEVRGPQGEPLSLLTGAETLPELKDLMLALCNACPAGKAHPHCPIRILSGLSHVAVTRLIQSMPRESCLNLFELELECRSRNDSCHADSSPA